jgi:hypothetical protein
MTRRLLNVLVLPSLLLCVASTVLWVRGGWARDGVWYTRDSVRYSLHTYRGRIWFWTLSPPNYPTASVWATKARMGPGLVWDSVADSWYDPFRGRPKGVRLPEDFLDAPSNGGPVDRRFLGFRYARNDKWWPLSQLPQGYPTARSLAIYVPHWAVVLLTGVLPVTWLVRTLRARRRLRCGLCPSCGYDLRATPGRCPECGEAAAPAGAAAQPAGDSDAPDTSE